MRQRRNRLAGSFAFATLVVALLAGPGWADDKSHFYATKLPATRSAPAFTLTDQSGQPFSSATLRGKLVLLSFGFTHCLNICPITLAHVADIYKSFSPGDQKQVQVLFVSIDPKRDTPAVLKDYVEFFDPHFIGLTGSADQVNEVAKAYAVEAAEYGIGHTTGVFLLGRSGACIGFYRENQLANRARVVDDLHRFLAMSAAAESAWQGEKVTKITFLSFSGRQLYLENCASCHKEDGRGVPGKYPSLIHSAWVLGAPNRLVALTLDGVRSAHRSAEGDHRGVMPAYRTILPPAYVAKVLTYIRQSWQNSAFPISAGYVGKLLSAQPPRSDFWSWEELDKLPPEKVDHGAAERLPLSPGDGADALPRDGS